MIIDASGARGGTWRRIRSAPWTLWVAAAIALLIAAYGVMMFGFMWYSWFGESPPRGQAVLFLVAGLVPLTLVVLAMAGYQAAWAAMVALVTLWFAIHFGRAARGGYFTGWIIFPMVSAALLLSVPTRRHVGARGGAVPG